MLGTPVRFDYTGAVQTYTVPAGCLGLVVDCVGAAGGNGNTIAGGKGGRVQCILNIASNQLLYIYIGEKGQYTAPTGTSLGGWNGGGDGYGSTYNIYGTYYNYGAGGGGASDIRIGGTALTDRKVVAGAGGGGFGTSNNPSQLSAIGSAGGGLIGESGQSWSSGGATYTGAGGGTQESGGIAGKHTYSGATHTGNPGSLGIGGNGYKPGDALFSGSGGGGGYYGGGGSIAGASTGGGSSYTDPNLCTDVVHTQGYSEATGNGWIILTPILPDAYERDPSADKAVIMHTKTYNAFTTAGYDEIGTLHGVYLKDIPDEYGISDAEYVATFEDQVGNTANKAHLMQYIGSKSAVDVPIGKKQG